MSSKTISQQLVSVQSIETGAVSAGTATAVYDGEFDPNYRSVAFSLDDVLYTDHLLKDKSSNRWDEFLGEDYYNRQITPSYFGPKYQDWATHFGDNTYSVGYYNVDDVPNLRFGSAAFTIEFWMKSMRNDATQHYVIGKGGNAGVTSGTGWVIGLTTTNTIFFYDAVGATTTTGSTVLLRDTWYHVAIVRSSTSASALKIYVGGALDATGTSAGNFTDNNVMKIGIDRVATAGSFFGSMLTDLRITLSAVYPSAFTAPTSALSMAGAVYGISMTSFHHSTTDYITVPYGNINSAVIRSRVIDSPFLNKTAMLTGHGSHSVSAWDDSRYMSIYDAQTGNNSLKFGTGVFTVEAWIYFSSYFSTDKHIIGKGLGNVNTAGTTGWGLGVSVYGQLLWYDNATTLNGAAYGSSVTITNYIGNNTTTVTGTVASTTGWQVGDIINILGATGTEQVKLLGTWVIASIPNSTTFTFVVSVAVSTGTLTTSLGTAYTRPAQTIYTCGWYHVAAVRQGTGTNQFAMYVNGKLVYTGTVATDYSQTQALTLFGTRAAQGAVSQNFGGWMCGLRLSTTARYTGAFTADQSILDASMTSDINTSLLMCTTGTNPPRSNHQRWIDYGQSRLMTTIPSSEMRLGQHFPTTRNGYSVFFYDASYNKLIANNSSGDLNFGTGDFSIELWCANNYSWDAISIGPRYILDTRVNFNDTGFVLRYNGWRRLEFWTSGRIILSESYVSQPSTEEYTHRWMHVCVQRVNGNMAMYVNGKKQAETRYVGTIGSPGTFNIGSGSYPNLQYTNGWQGWMSDLRVLKGAGAYTGYTDNPNSITVPTQALTAIANCVLLTFNQNILGDYSGRGNTVSFDRYTTAGSINTNSWNVYVCNKSPYSGQAWDPNTQIYADCSDSNSGFYARGAYNNSDSTRYEFSWISRMVKPWTIEMWIYSQQTNPASPTSYTHAYTASSAGHEGFQLRSHYSAGAVSYGNLSFTLWTAFNSSSTNISTTSGTAIQQASWNHIAVVYDPTATNKMAIFANGIRVATSTSALTAGQRTWNTYQLYSNTVGMADFRVSTVARYSNDSVGATYTIPTQTFAYDANTYTLIKVDAPFFDKALQMGCYWYGTQVSYQYKKFGNGSIKFPNKETGLVDRISIGQRTWAVMGMSPRYGDYTVETWACWWDATAGGKNFDATTGNWLFSFNGDHIRVGVSPTTGVWKFQYAATTNAFTLISSTVSVATATSGNWDHIALVRKNGSYTFYINGLEIGTMLMSGTGTQSGGNGPTGDQIADLYNTTLVIGCDNSTTQTTSWSGYIQDFRVSMMARYETAVINNVATMVYAGTNKPALPTKFLQTK